MKLSKEIAQQLLTKIESTFDDLKRLFKNKNKNYGCSIFTTDPLCSSIDPVTAVTVRLNDKINRLATLMNSDVKDEVGESIADTLYDLAVYSIILANMYEFSHEITVTKD